MALVDRPDARIYRPSLGHGEPVVLVMGRGCRSAKWFRIAPQLARSDRVILLDNRGSGQTRVPRALVHRAPSMAADVPGVLDAAGESRAHVAGFSMGGMISQQFAIDLPKRLRSLTLLGTHPGGPWAVQAAMHVRQRLFAKAHMGTDQSLRRVRPHTCGLHAPQDLSEEDARVRLATPPSTRDDQAQLLGLIYWLAYTFLPLVKAPTSVMQGLQDALIPPANGRLLASRLANATLIELPEARHRLMTDTTVACPQALQAHLNQHRS